MARQNKKTSGKIDPYSDSSKVLKLSIALALIPFFLAWFHFANPYFYQYKIVKLTMYSLILLIPVLIDTLFAIAGIYLNDQLFFVLIYAYYLALFFFLLRAYFNKPKLERKKFIIKICVAYLIYLIVAVYALW